MQKDFDKWNIKKKEIHNQKPAVFCHQREIWWCSLGTNVGNVVNHLSEDPHGFCKRCYQAALSLHHRKMFPVFIGGDHSISAPLIRACREVHEDLTLIHFDAHTDLAEWDPSESHHHGNVMTRVLHENPGLGIHQFGIRGFVGVSSHNERCHVIRQREIDADLDNVISCKSTMLVK